LTFTFLVIMEDKPIEESQDTTSSLSVALLVATLLRKLGSEQQSAGQHSTQFWLVVVL
jgi:hypothetical protein